MFNSAKDMVRGMFKARGILCAMLLCGLPLLTAGQAGFIKGRFRRARSRSSCRTAPAAATT